MKADVVIVGGGVIGLSIAYELAGQGVRVTLLEQGRCGQEASWAGAGILPPGNLRHATTPEARLRGLSHDLWPGLHARLLDETGMDNGFRRCGGITLKDEGGRMKDEFPIRLPPSSFQEEIDAWRREGVTVEPLDHSALGALEPQLSPSLTAGFRLPELGQVRNPRHVTALLAACTARGVTVCEGQPAVR
ncbi:MAG: NAD(P)/FAD-dependent oxidoreductase, partial [Planctomycetaceae bacterium]